MGELNGMRGFVPYNMVEEVAPPDTSPAPPPSPHSPQKRTHLGMGPADSPDRNFSSSLNTTTNSSAGKLIKSKFKLKMIMVVIAVPDAWTPSLPSPHSPQNYKRTHLVMGLADKKFGISRNTTTDGSAGKLIKSK